MFSVGLGDGLSTPGMLWAASVGSHIPRVLNGLSARWRGASATTRLRDGNSRDSAFGNDQVARILVDINALAAAAIAAGAPHSVIQGGETAIIREVDVGAFA